MAEFYVAASVPGVVTVRLESRSVANVIENVCFFSPTISEKGQ